jgi:hypothetical protein
VSIFYEPCRFTSSYSESEKVPCFVLGLPLKVILLLGVHQWKILVCREVDIFRKQAFTIH